MKRLLLISLLSLLTCPFLQGEPKPAFAAQGEPDDLIVHNRILAKVNGKTISVIDLMRKMDLFLQRNYPHLVSSKLARYQYYSSQWRQTLTLMIDQELMLADAAHMQVKITDSDVREEVLSRFGPNVMATLDNLGITYDEARTMTHDEMLVQRIMWYRVQAKAFSNVNPQEIKEAYRKYCAKNPPREQWRYQVLSIRSTQREQSEMLAKRAFDLLRDKRMEMAALPPHLKSEDEKTTVTLSPELEADEKNLSDSHKVVLKDLKPGSFSTPVSQVSRADQSIVYRIFYLKDYSIQKTPPFEKMAEDLREELLQEAFARENAQYITKLRERLGFDEKHMLETLPPDFQPFAVR